MSTRRRRLLGSTIVVVLVASVPFAAALTVARMGEAPAAALPAVEGLPPLTAPGPACVARGAAPDAEGATDGGDVVPEGSRVSSADVLRCPAAFDGLRVTYAGEVVGDVLHRRGGAWVLVNDDAYALVTGPLPGHRTSAGTNTGLAVWVPEELLDGLGGDGLGGPGRPGRRGDVVLVSARVVRVDPEDAGGLTLRAESMRIVAPSVEVPEPLDVPRLVLAVVLVLLAAVARSTGRDQADRPARMRGSRSAKPSR